MSNEKSSFYSFSWGRAPFCFCGSSRWGVGCWVAGPLPSIGPFVLSEKFVCSMGQWPAFEYCTCSLSGPAKHIPFFVVVLTSSTVLCVEAVGTGAQRDGVTFPRTSSAGRAGVRSQAASRGLCPEPRCHLCPEWDRPGFGSRHTAQPLCPRFKVGTDSLSRKVAPDGGSDPRDPGVGAGVVEAQGSRRVAGPPPPPLPRRTPMSHARVPGARPAGPVLGGRSGSWTKDVMDLSRFFLKEVCLFVFL